MNFKRMFESQEARDMRVMNGLLGHAYGSVKYQMETNPINRMFETNIEKARCRLNLYVLNVGFLHFYISRAFSNDSVVYAVNLMNHLVEVIYEADKEIIDYWSILFSNQSEISNAFSKEELKKYVKRQAEKYYDAVEEKRRTMLNSNPEKVNMEVVVDQVTKLFCKECLDLEHSEVLDFALEFTQNISNQNLVIFGKEIEELAA